MSLTTAFPFQAFMGDLKTRHVMESKEGMSLSLLTPEDMERMAFVEVRVRCGDEDHTAPWQPVTRRTGTLATFYDTRMGNFDARTFPTQPCSTCSQALTGKFGNERCQGHFGFISMPSRYPNDPARQSEKVFVINPHLAEETELLLQAECFFCHRLRVPEFDVERYRQALVLVDAGLTGEALHFLDVTMNSRGQEARNRRRRDANEEIINDVRGLREHVARILKEHHLSGNGTSAAAEAAAHDKAMMPVLDIRNELCKQAAREFKEYMSVCSHCQCISPRITTKHGHLFFFFNRKSAEFNMAQGVLTNAQLRAWSDTNQRQQRKHTYYTSTMARDHIKQLCQHEGAILQALYPHMGESTIAMPYDCPLPANLLYKVFFTDKILVPPLPLRLASGVQVSETGRLSPDEQTRDLSAVLGFVEEIEAYFTLKNNSTAERNLVSERQEIAHEQNLRNLQAKVTEVYMRMLDTFAKKEGLFRMHMMGKRVNQACRSVISPDYLVEPNEVLLPRPFARGLTFPEQVTNYAPARALLLKQCVINGPSIYPGASHLEIRHASGEVRFVDLNTPPQARRQQAQRYFAMVSQTGGTLIVHRHILDGDRLIFNRQPTLHKASMMGYRAKVLSGLKTLRFHYVNGKSYNADFDGDEMNVHIPQSLEAKAELDCIMDANMNYLVPTSGKPIRGLIQDHIVAGVLLTLRDKFLDHGSFVQLVFNGVAPYMHAHGRPFASTATLTDLIPVPAVLKPRPLWTGKQLISVLVRYVTGAVEAATRGTARPSSAAVTTGSSSTDGVTLHGTSLVQPSAYTTTDPITGKLRSVAKGAMDDDHVQFLKSELVTGVLCKNQLGPANLSVAHVIHEIYGPHMVGELFGAFGRVLTMSLQREGFSMGMDDMCLVQEPRRAQLLRELDEAPLSLPEDEAKVMPAIMGLATQLQKEFVPGRMMVPFPRNQLLMMTMSGAKGSNTNTIQMALGLGQQLFDGRRVKRMNSGKTLPAFFIGEKRARSFGYAMGRFASGIRPPEYTIHAMAGRDGLIDTAVKTSRSGHLQRCLIKGLESLVVHWDHSVRDANGSVVQFIYGGDGLDPMKASSLQAWDVAKDNVYELCRKYGVDSGMDREGGEEDAAGSARPSTNLPDNTEAGAGTPSARPSIAGGKRGRPDEALAALRAAREAAVSQQVAADPLPAGMQRGLSTYLNGGKADYVLFQKVSQVARWSQQKKLTQKLREKREENVQYLSGVLGDVTARKRLRAYCDAGEPVGLLAAQAAGEPSTQMTLNTFHSAGSTVTHVTEGIPRLRELLIHASVKNAAIVVPVEKATEADEAALTKILNAGVETRLLDCLACGTRRGDTRDGEATAQPHKGYHFHIERGPEKTQLLLSLLLSKHLLAVSREKMCMSPAEHLDSVKAALLGLAKQVVSVLRGRGDKGDGGGAGAMHSDALQHAVQDPAQMGSGAADSDDDNAAVSDADEDGERSTIDGDARSSQPPATPGMGPRTRGPRGGRAVAAVNEEQEPAESEEDSDDDNDDDDNNGSAARRRSRKAADGEDDGHDDDDVDALAASKAQASGQESYDTFSAVCGAYGNRKFTVEIAPLSVEAATAAGAVPLGEDLFVVNILISMPPSVVAVMHDVVDLALTRQKLPSWLPQFEQVTFTRKAEDVTSGELVFQGASATIRQVSAFLSLFTLNAKAIKVRKARSTDIQDMRVSLGVESAYKSLFDELDKLFRRYAVDYHHLTLIADAATHRGRWENYNFTGVISHSASPLFQMTFASSKRFLHTSLTRGVGDELDSISSAIMVGERPRVGTAFAKVSQDAGILSDVIERTFA